MTTQSSRDNERLSVASLPATPRQRKISLAFCAGIAAAAAIIATIGLAPLPRSDGFVPAVQSIIAAVEFLTAVLLFAQYLAERSRAVLLLGAGYLLSSLTVVAHTLTFPGAFSATGLLGAGPQTAAWLYVVWHLTLPAAAYGYALLKSRPAPPGVGVAPAAAIVRTIVLVVAAAAGLTWLVIAVDESLPTLVLSSTTFATTASVVTALPLLMSAAALVVLWRRRTSVLDEWLLVALVASLAEMALVVGVGASRYTFTFYAARQLAVIASSAVLVALLSEITGLYLRLTAAVNALQREQANRLMNLDVVIGSIAHEVKQPLMVITTCNTIITSLLRKPKIDAAEVEVNLEDVTKAAIRIGETIDSLRGLFKDPREAHEHVDINTLVLESLETLRAQVAGNGIAVTTELSPNLPPVIGHRGQLREVLVNIVQNAIDELTHIAGDNRALRLRTRASEMSRVLVTIEDSGPGIAPERLPNLFTAFITTKARGMGLGLSLCQMIVDRHNGELSVSSEVGKGTRFEVSLPAETQAARTSLSAGA